MPPPKKDEPGCTEYREQYALSDQSQLVYYSVVSDYAHDFGGRSIRLSVSSMARRLLCGQRPRDYKDDDLADLASHTRRCRLSGSTIKGWKGIPRRRRASPV